jgi:hypothetical protein
MSAQDGAGSRAQTSLRTTSALDYGWWASNGPTAGYLARRAIDALEQSPDAGRGQVRHAHVQVLRLAAADAMDISVARASGTHGIARASFTFGQGGEFAVATLTVGPRLGHSGTGDAAPPAALPLDAYVPMITPSPTLPPVTAQFEYRPTADQHGRGPRPGWDVVWVTPTDPHLRGHALVASIIDCWYPPSFMRSVGEHLRGRKPLAQPAPTVLISASISFPADQAVYDHVRHALLANHLSAAAEGYCFERSEVWSDRGELLATAELIRASLDP